MTGRRLVTIDLDRVDPDHLEELAWTIRHERERRLARLAELADRPALGAYLRKEAT
jgi:hypothetical protein